MTTSETVVLHLPPKACSSVIGSLWAVAASLSGDERTGLLRVAAQVHIALCRSLEVNPLASLDLLFVLPQDLRRQFADQVTSQVRLHDVP
jgi:hypothetical protein